mmetsp:Transcript_41623/g.114766  ORF Transcript_41623/g.114766 Transcript_41623/m.114766 type:complete len:374 (+) Transcript_41623:84-1205(+)
MDDAPPAPSEETARLFRQCERDGIDTRFLDQPFLELSELGDAAALRRRLSELGQEEQRGLLKSVDQQGRTGLLLAVAKGDNDLVDALLDASANPNDADNFGATALHYAASRGSASSTASLLRACAEVSRRDDQGEEPLMWAFGEPVVAALLRSRADANARSAVSGRTALMFAASRGDLGAAGLLSREPGIQLDVVDAKGFSALALAEEAGHAAVAALLAELGAASLGRGAAPQPDVIHVAEALCEAARRGDSAACARLLSGSGADPNVDVDGETPLLAAASAGSIQTAQVLLAARADPNVADKFLGETPVMRAVLENGAPELLWLLLEAKADPSRRDNLGREPAEVAASWGRDVAVEILRAACAGDLPLGAMD